MKFSIQTSITNVSRVADLPYIDLSSTHLPSIATYMQSYIAHSRVASRELERHREKHLIIRRMNERHREKHLEARCF